MKGYRTGKRSVFPSVLCAILLFSCLWQPAPGLALMALPDIGIDYQTMKVIQAAKLTGAGMTNVRNGDAISMRSSPQEGKILFKNLRTNEEMVYPPVQRRRKKTSRYPRASTRRRPRHIFIGFSSLSGNIAGFQKINCRSDSETARRDGD